MRKVACYCKEYTAKKSANKDGCQKGKNGCIPGQSLHIGNPFRQAQKVLAEQLTVFLIK